MRTPLNPLYSDGGEVDVQHVELILRTNDWNNQAYRRALLKTMMQKKSFLQLVVQTRCSKHVLAQNSFQLARKTLVMSSVH